VFNGQTTFQNIPFYYDVDEAVAHTLTVVVEDVAGNTAQAQVTCNLSGSALFITPTPTPTLTPTTTPSPSPICYGKCHGDTTNCHSDIHSNGYRYGDRHTLPYPDGHTLSDTDQQSIGHCHAERHRDSQCHTHHT
jgi:hypothetical protein